MPRRVSRWGGVEGRAPPPRPKPRGSLISGVLRWAMLPVGWRPGKGRGGGGGVTAINGLLNRSFFLLVRG